MASGVAKILRPQRAQLWIEFVDPWHAGWNVELRDRLVGSSLEHLYQRAQAVAMRRDQDVAAGPQLRRDLLFPARPHALQRARQGFGSRQARVGEPPCNEDRAGDAGCRPPSGREAECRTTAARSSPDRPRGAPPSPPCQGPAAPHSGVRSIASRGAPEPT